jgi:beta-phosphoglucomutase-like phosphatase (HAD superfamily)
MLAVVGCELEEVLVDTRPARRSALAHALAAEGLPHPAAAVLDAAAGLDADAGARLVLSALAVDDPTVAALVALRAERDAAARLGQGSVLRPGARQWIESIAAAAPLVIVSRAQRAIGAPLLALAGLDAFVAGAVWGDEAEAKPSPAPYLRALERLRRRGLGAGPGHLVALEVSAAGIASAHAAGFAVFGVGDAALAQMPGMRGAWRSLDGVSAASIAAALKTAPRLNPPSRAR